MRIGGLVLAAGEGSRFGGTKQLAAVGGRPMLEHALASVAALSIIGEIVAMRHGRTGGRLAQAQGRIHEVGV